jgi:hypothetical protein
MIVERLDLLTASNQTASILCKQFEQTIKYYINAMTHHCVQSGEVKKLSDMCEFEGKSKRNASHGTDTGKYPFYTSSAKARRCDDADYQMPCMIIGTGGHANIKYDEQFGCSADNFVIRSNTHETKYIYYYLHSDLRVLEQGFKGSTIKHLSKSYVSDILIPLPEKKTQSQIIAYCDNLTHMIHMQEQHIQSNIMLMRQIVEVYLNNKPTVKPLPEPDPRHNHSQPDDLLDANSCIEQAEQTIEAEQLEHTIEAEQLEHTIEAEQPKLKVTGKPKKDKKLIVRRARD